MRYSKRALLLFGLGIVFGFAGIIVAAEAIDRSAAILMALGLAVLPAAILFDLLRLSGLGRTRSRFRGTRGRSRTRTTRRSPQRAARRAAPARRRR
jgi:hypothetical protein